MRIGAPLAAALALALSPLAFAADTDKGPWDGFKEGTWVQTKTTTKMSIPGVDAPDQVSESRQTLVKVTDAEWVIKTETKEGEAWGNASEFKYPRVAPKGTGEAKDAPKPEDLGSESVTVDGKDYACKKQKYTVEGTVTISWESAEQGTLKAESTSSDGTTVKTLVTALAKKAKVGDKEVTCRETKTVSKGAGSESTTVYQTSDGVPGHTVRMEMNVTAPAKMTTVSETVAFEAK